MHTPLRRRDAVMLDQIVAPAAIVSVTAVAGPLKRVAAAFARLDQALAGRVRG